ncbi:hypothetical protein pdam_00026018, partial [Pocillopora damicornis]
MVVPKQLVEQALVEVHDGVAGAHLGGMESLMKMKARFRRPGTTKEVHSTRDEHLDFCLMAYRSSVHSSTGHNPFELMFGRETRIPLDAMVGRAED